VEREMKILMAPLVLDENFRQVIAQNNRGRGEPSALRRVTADLMWKIA
jgi:hypothetical protein